MEHNVFVMSVISIQMVQEKIFLRNYKANMAKS